MLQSSGEEEEEKSDMFIAQLYKFMDDRSTPINKPAQLYNRDVNLSKLYRKVRKYGGFTKVSAIGECDSVMSGQLFNSSCSDFCNLRGVEI